MSPLQYGLGMPRKEDAAKREAADDHPAEGANNLASAPEPLPKRPKVLTASKILGVASPRRPRIGPDFQATIPPQQAPPPKRVRDPEP